MKKLATGETLRKEKNLFLCVSVAKRTCSDISPDIS